MRIKRFAYRNHCSVTPWFAESARLETFIQEKLKEVGYEF